MAPRTICARWQAANASSAVPILASLITNQQGGALIGRWTTQCRLYRLPRVAGAVQEDSVPGEKGRQPGLRNMVVLRSTFKADEMWVMVEDMSMPTRSSAAATNDPAIATRHLRWSSTTFATPGGAAQPPLDLLVNRVLGVSPMPAAAKNAAGAWIPRTSSVQLEGFIFLTGLTPVAPAGEWLIRVGSVTNKGGTAGAQQKGVFIEATYLPVPSFPAGSTFAQDFVLSLFPKTSVDAGEIQFCMPSREDLYECGVIKHLNPPLVDGEDYEEEQWTDRHTNVAIARMLKREGYF